MYSFLSFLIIFYIFYYYPSEACVFSNERPKESRSVWEEKWGGTGRSGRRVNYNQDILLEKNNLFSIKGKKLRVGDCII